MQIAIDIPDGCYEELKKARFPAQDTYRLVEWIKTGIPLPKGHGRLIDADDCLAKAWQNFYKNEDEWEKKDKDYIPIHRFYNQNGFECCQQAIVNAPTIVEADKEVEDGD